MKYIESHITDDITMYDHDWEQAYNRLRQLEKKQSVLERLVNAFSGYYGKFISLHFAPSDDMIEILFDDAFIIFTRWKRIWN